MKQTNLMETNDHSINYFLPKITWKEDVKKGLLRCVFSLFEAQLRS